MIATTLPTLPRGGGVGLKPEHFRTILDTRPAIGFFEVHAENYMVAGGPFHHYLERIRADYPLSIHGVGLSIGGAGPLDESHLDRLAMLLDRYQPESFSEHLAWSSHGGTFLNDLLPVPYHRATLDRVCAHIDHVQSRLKRVMLLENPATYVEFDSSTMSETDFIGAVLRRTGCGLLLDVNNVHVACTNHGRDPYAYIRALPLETVDEIHLAGFTRDMDAAGDPLLIDSHGTPVAQAVWDLYRYTLGLTGPMSTLIERDNDIPAFEVLLAEAQTAERIMASVTLRGADAAPVIRQDAFATALLDMAGAFPPDLITWNRSDPGKRFAVYRNNVAISLIDALADTYPVVQQLVGAEFFRAMARAFARAHPPNSPVMAHYGAGFAEFVSGFPPVAALPYLADVARLEWLYVQAYHAADAAPLPADDLAAVLADTQSLPDVRFVLHPAVRVLRSTHPVVSLWAAHQTDDSALALAAVDLATTEAALLLRPALDVEIHRIDPAAADFIARLQEGMAFGAAVAGRETFDLPTLLGQLIRSGAIFRIDTARSSS